MRVLYIEDDEDAIEATKIIFGRATPPVTLKVARTMEEGITCLKAWHDYDVVLTDIRLPDGDGRAILGQVRGRSLPLAVIVLTAAGDEETAIAAIKAGADDYIAKRPGYLAMLHRRLVIAVETRQSQASRLARPLRILYLEDSEEEAEMVTLYLRRHAPHLQVEVVSSPEEALSRLVSRQNGASYQVVLVDFRLGQGTGLDFLAELKLRDGLPIPVVFITAFGDEEVAVQALKLGAADYVVKRNGYLLKLPSVLENAYHQISFQLEHSRLLQSEAKYRTLVENLPALTYIVNSEDPTYDSYISPQVKTILGYAPDQWLGLSTRWIESIHPEDRPWVTDRRRQAELDGDFFEAEYRMIAKDGRHVWVQDAWSLITDASGKPVCRQGVAIDITRRKEAELALARSEQQYSELFENALDIVFTTDIAGMPLSVNRAAEKISGHSRGFLLSRPLERFVAPEYLETNLRTLSEMVKSGNTHVEELEILAQDGRRVPLEVSLFPVLRDGKVTGVQGIARDISERKESENRLRESYQKLQRVLSETVQAMGLTIETRDPYTAGHQERVARLGVAIGQELALPADQIMGIDVAGRLHDIGKISVPSEILSRPGKLAVAEFSIIKGHPQVGHDIVSGIEFPWPVAMAILHHHERLDGSGYPAGLTTDETLFEAKILAVADVVEAMSSHRPYRPSLGIDRALEEIALNRGKLYDANVVDACLTLFRKREFRLD